jgi:hypothetical protein
MVSLYCSLKAGLKFPHSLALSVDVGCYLYSVSIKSKPSYLLHSLFQRDASGQSTR